MKKSVIIAVLGVITSVVSSQAQGYIQFSSYAQTVGNPIATQFVGGANVDSPYVAQLYFALGTVSDPVLGNSASIIAAPSGAFTLIGSASTGTYPTPFSGGYFDGGGVVVPGYTSGPITFEVVAYNGSSYANAASRGRTGSFTMTSIRTDGINSNFGDNGTPMPAFFVAPVPEPTTLALAGLGGLASLVALRRKQA
jgi:hypothetical protein